MNLKQLNEVANDAHSALIYHEIECQACKEAGYVSTMCPHGRELATQSRKATQELDDGYEMHFAIKRAEKRR